MALTYSIAFKGVCKGSANGRWACGHAPTRECRRAASRDVSDRNVEKKLSAGEARTMRAPHVEWGDGCHEVVVPIWAEELPEGADDEKTLVTECTTAPHVVADSGRICIRSISNKQ